MYEGRAVETLIGWRTDAETGLSRFEASNHGRCAMSKNMSSTDGRATEFGLTLEQLIRRGARDLLQSAIEMEIRELVPLRRLPSNLRN